MSDEVAVVDLTESKTSSWEEKLEVARKACINPALAKAELDVKDLQCRLEAAKDIATAKRLSPDNDVFLRGEAAMHAACLLNTYGLVLVSREVLVTIGDWIKRGAEVLPDSVGALFGTPEHARSLEYAGVNLILHQVGDNESHGRNNDVDWDTADETWLVEGWLKVDDIEVRKIMHPQLFGPSLGNPSDAEELGWYRHSRYIEYDDVVLLRFRSDCDEGQRVEGSHSFEYSRSESSRPLSELEFISVVGDEEEDDDGDDVEIVGESDGHEEKRRKIE